MSIFKQAPAGYFDIRKDQEEAPVVRPVDQPRQFGGHVFICGLHRSGTSMVEAQLHARCDVAVLRANVSENEGQHLQDVYPRGLDHGGPGKFAFSPAMHGQAVAPDQAAGLRDRLLRCWTPWVEGQSNVLLEKSPPNLVRIPCLRSVFPGAKFVIVTREPRVVAAATTKWARMSVPELVFHWQVAHQAAAAAMGPDCAHIRYEELCETPKKVIGRVIAALGLPERKVMLDLPDRFARMDNSNQTYLSKMPDFEFGQGIWEQFGY